MIKDYTFFIFLCAEWHKRLKLIYAMYKLLYAFFEVINSFIKMFWDIIALTS